MSNEKSQPSGVGEPRELLPCPFCGSKAEIVKNDFPPRNKWWHPSCTKYTCPAHVVEQDEQGGTQCDVFTDEEARNLWNTRTVAPREVGEGLREALEIARHALKNGSTLDDRYRAYIAVKAALAAPAPKPDSHQPQGGQHDS